MVSIILDQSFCEEGLSGTSKWCLQMFLSIVMGPSLLVKVESLFDHQGTESDLVNMLDTIHSAAAGNGRERKSDWKRLGAEC